MKSFITFFREAYLPPTGSTASFDVSSLPTGVPIYIGDGKPVKSPKKSLDSLDLNTNSKSNIPSTPATQKLNTSDQNVKDTPNLNLNQEKLGTHAIRYYMK
jgi:hypothetical protein